MQPENRQQHVTTIDTETVLVENRTRRDNRAVGRRFDDAAFGDVEERPLMLVDLADPHEQQVAAAE